MKSESVQQPLPQLPANVPPPPVLTATQPGSKPGVKSQAIPGWITQTSVGTASKATAGQKQLVGQ